MPDRHGVIVYALAICIVLLTYAVRVSLNPDLPPYLFFVPYAGSSKLPSNNRTS